MTDERQPRRNLESFRKEVKRWRPDQGRQRAPGACRGCVSSALRDEASPQTSAPAFPPGIEVICAES